MIVISVNFKEDPEAPYGLCPECKAPGKARERRPNGNDICANGHSYPSKNAIERDARFSTIQYEAGLYQVVVDDIKRAIVIQGNNLTAVSPPAGDGTPHRATYSLDALDAIRPVDILVM